MCPIQKVQPNDLYRSCELSEIPFDSSDKAPELKEIVGQDRAVEAIKFGISIHHEGYNLFALGPHGIGKQTLLQQFLNHQASQAATPPDWCYVANLAEPRRPRALQLPPGKGAKLKAEMAQVVTSLTTSMRTAFSSEEYRTRKQRLLNELKEQQERAFVSAQEEAKRHHVAVVRTDTGIAMAPVQGEVVIDPAEFSHLPKAEQEKIQANLAHVGATLQTMFQQFHEWAHQHQEKLEALDRETAASVAKRVFDGIRDGYRELPEVLGYLSELEADATKSAGDFLETEDQEGPLQRVLQQEPTDGSFRRYQVNLVVDNSSTQGAPVIYEDHPTYSNLIGRIEHISQFGALLTDFTLIRAGALHRASGGYLLLDALKVLQNPFAWEGLKRALRTKEIRIEPLGQAMDLVPTLTLEPAPLPFAQTKVVLFGERLLYYLLSAADPDFSELFKVMVDFEESMDRLPGTNALFANLLAGLAKKEGLKPLERGAIGRVIEQASRLAGDAEKLSVHMRPIVDLLREADFWSGQAGHLKITSDDVQAALDAQLRRAGRAREGVLEMIRRGMLLIDTTGQKIGQLNGLVVLQLGEQSFGHPTRISARVRLGKGEVINIEREVELSGPIHSKGVLILSSFLGARYAAHTPLSLSASLVFEQSYGGVEGDSASLAELCVLLSAIAEAPLSQSLAMTGSVNQHGEVQPIGGVNEKIEGFFAVCRDRGLTGAEGVIIPKSNLKNLMLKKEVVAAVQEERFRIYAVEHVDDALELLTGVKAGTRDEQGKFAPDSLNAKIEARLATFAEDVRRFTAKQS